MKFEDFLMEASEQQRKRHVLEEEVEKLEAELEYEQAMNKALRAAFRWPMFLQPRISLLLLPPQVQELIKELAAVEAEILCLDRKIQELKLRLYHERKQNEERQMQLSHQKHHQRRRLSRHNHLAYEIDSGVSLRDDLRQRSRSQNYEQLVKDKTSGHTRASVGSAADFWSMTSMEFIDEIHELSRMHNSRMKTRFQIIEENRNEEPNGISEQLIKCLIGIFLEFNQISHGREGSTTVPKLSLPCAKRASFSRKTNLYTYYQNALNLDPYGILPDSNATIRDIGPYKNFIHITRSSIDVSRFTECSAAVGRLRVLMEKLSEIDLSFLTYKQKLAFWINIYNACIMHAFLEHGLPSSQDKLLAIMNKASLNVGGIMLNALAVEHFILRHPSEPAYGTLDEKEALLRHAYGLGYSEPNVTFALCRGTWSSPALRVYTPDEVVNDLGRARVEYLEASVGVSSKRRVVVPKLLQLHMRDFADDMESLLEWIYSQLPRSSSLKGMMMECLNRKTRSPTAKIVEIQPCVYEFRYLLSL